MNLRCVSKDIGIRPPSWLTLWALKTLHVETYPRNPEFNTKSPSHGIYNLNGASAPSFLVSIIAGSADEEHVQLTKAKPKVVHRQPRPYKDAAVVSDLLKYPFKVYVSFWMVVEHIFSALDRDRVHIVSS